MASNFFSVQPIKAVKRFSQRQKKRNDVSQSHCFIRYNQGMGSVDPLACFISQYWHLCKEMVLTSLPRLHQHDS